MISDASLYTLAVFLGAAAMLMIVLYHFLEVNSDEALALKTEPATGVMKSGSLKDSAAALAGNAAPHVNVRGQAQGIAL